MEIIRPLMTRQRIEKREKKKHLFGKCVWKVSTGKVRKWENEKIRGTSLSFFCFSYFVNTSRWKRLKNTAIWWEKRERELFSFWGSFLLLPHSLVYIWIGSLFNWGASLIEEVGWARIVWRENSKDTYQQSRQKHWNIRRKWRIKH